MQTMKTSSLLMVAVLLAFCHNVTAENVEINFNYEDDHRVDFSQTKGSLKVGEFKDERDLDDSTLITSVNYGSNAGGYNAELPIADIMRSALIQGFESGGASLTKGDADFTIVGSILAVDATEIDRAGVATIQLTFRTKLELQGGGRTIWQTTLFGRGRSAVEEGVVPAVHEALSRTIRELVRDDYFKMEIL